MANQTTQEIGETIDPFTIGLGLWTERMEFIVSPLKYDVILDKNWKNNHHATIDCSNNYVHFKYAGNKCMIHATETMEDTSLGSRVKGWRNGCPMFSVLIYDVNRNSTDDVKRNTEIVEVIIRTSTEVAINMFRINISILYNSNYKNYTKKCMYRANWKLGNYYISSFGYTYHFQSLWKRYVDIISRCIVMLIVTQRSLRNKHT